MESLLEEDKMKKAFPKTVVIVCICFLLILSCTPAGQKRTDTHPAGGKPVAEEAQTIKIGLVGPFPEFSNMWHFTIMRSVDLL